MEKAVDYCINYPLGVEDPTHRRQMRPIVTKTISKSLKERWHNVRSRHRTAMKNKGERSPEIPTCWWMKEHTNISKNVRPVMDLDKEEEGQLLMMPNVELVKLAMQTSPADATPEMKEAMDVMLNMAIPAVEPRVMKKKHWFNGKTTHSFFFGDTWPIEFATGLLLLEHFSETSRIYKNLGYWDMKTGHPIPKADRIEPESKDRSKDICKETEAKIEDDQMALCVWVGDLFEKDGAKKRMDDWDMLCCGNRGKKKSSGDRLCTVPTRAAQQETAPAEKPIDHTARLLARSGLVVNGQVVRRQQAV